MSENPAVSASLRKFLYIDCDCIVSIFVYVLEIFVYGNGVVCLILSIYLSIVNRYLGCVQ